MTLKELRLNKGITYDKIEDSNFHRGDYYRYEYGKLKISNMSLKNAILLSEIFGLEDPEELLNYEPFIED